MQGGRVTIMTNRANRTLYVGVTANLARRVARHQSQSTPGVTRTHPLNRLVHAEPHPTILGAIQREKNIKHWPRVRKVGLILATNPTWSDLSSLTQ